MSNSRDAWSALLMKRAKPHKYGAKQKVVDNVTFDSTKEANYYVELKHRLSAGEISDLELQPRFPIVIKGVLVCTYVADFRYVEAGQPVITDCKGVRTPEYRLKKKLVEAVYGIQILEV